MKHLKLFDSYNSTSTTNSGDIIGLKPYTWNSNGGYFVYTDKDGVISKIVNIDKMGVSCKEYLKTITTLAKSRPEFFPEFSEYKEDLDIMIPSITSTYAKNYPSRFE